MRKSPEKKQERERVRLTLMRATLELAEVHGFSSLGLREISREAGIAPTSFYRHFADVEELGLGIIERLVGPRLGEIGARVEKATDDGHDPVDVLVTGLFTLAVEDPALMRFMLAERSGSHPSFRRDLESQLDRLLASLGAALPESAPKRAPAAALSAVLLGCADLLEGAPEERSALFATLRPPVVEATRWVLRRPSWAAEKDDHG